MCTSKNLHDLRAGDVIRPRTWPASFGSWNRYAAVNDEFYPVHMDHDAARRAGMPAAFGMGNLQVAYFNALLDDWLDDLVAGRGRIDRLAVSFRSPSLEGTVTASGSVTSISTDAGATRVELALRSSDHEDRDLCTGTAVVVLDAGPTT